MNRIFKYEKLFRVDFMHAYYRSLLTEDFSIRPTDLTARILRSHGLLFKPAPSGFTVYADVKEDGTLKNEISSSLKFTFIISCRNPGFTNFTSLPLETAPGEIYCFCNRDVNAVDVFGLGTTRLLLHGGGNVSESDLVTYTGTSYSFIHTASGSVKTFRLFSEDTGSEMISREIVSDNGTFVFRQILEGFPEGFYRLEVAPAILDRVYYCPDRALKTAFGIIEIRTDVPAGNQFLAGINVISEKQYIIAFLNRSTYWRYKVTNKSGISLPDPAVAVGNDTSRFERDTSLNFTSRSPMALKEEPDKGIRLLKEAAVLSSEILKDLPNPGTGQIIPVKRLGTTTIFSDIFIYL